jgi:hypothetical protein
MKKYLMTTKELSEAGVTRIIMPSTKNKYPDWLRKAASKGGKAKSAAKIAAARANAKLGGRPRKTKRVARRAND